MLYVDHCASSPLRPAALAACEAALRESGNAVSPHALGRAARRRVDEAASAVRALAGSAAAEVVFTGSGTEANNLALVGAARLASVTERRRVLLLEGAGAGLRSIAAGLVDEGFTVEELAEPALLARIADVQARDVALVAVALVYETSGRLAPLAEVSQRASAAGVSVHVDASLAAGRAPLTFDAWGISSLALSAHRFGGPRGVGALVVRKGNSLPPLWGGGPQEGGMRPGSQAVGPIAGMGVAARQAAEDAALLLTLERAVADRLAEVPGLVVRRDGEPRAAGWLCLEAAGVTPERFAEQLDEQGVAAGVSGGCVRLTLGWSSTGRELEGLPAALGAALARARGVA